MTPFNIDEAQERLARLVRQRLDGPHPRAAVLVPFLLVDGQPSVLLTVRSDSVGTHKGHVSFPGGKMEPSDDGLAQTALREFEEELGVDRSRVRLLGAHHDVQAISDVLVTPYVGFLGELSPSEIDADKNEVAEVFTIAIDDLLDEKKRHKRSLAHKGQSHRIMVFDAGPAPVWGLTAHILHKVLEDAFGFVLR